MNPVKSDILHSIKNTLQSVLPSGGHAFLYGSQARVDARVDSNWDILILLDNPKIDTKDYDNVSYPYS